MNRRDFITSTSALAALSATPVWAQVQDDPNSFPASVLQADSPCVEQIQIDGYHNASPAHMRLRRYEVWVGIH